MASWTTHTKDTILATLPKNQKATVVSPWVQRSKIQNFWWLMARDRCLSSRKESEYFSSATILFSSSPEQFGWYLPLLVKIIHWGKYKLFGKQPRKHTKKYFPVARTALSPGIMTHNTNHHTMLKPCSLKHQFSFCRLTGGFGWPRTGCPGLGWACSCVCVTSGSARGWLVWGGLSWDKAPLLCVVSYCWADKPGNVLVAVAGF